MKKGFSLLELLLTLAIITILGGIAFPFAVRAGRNNRDAQKLEELNRISQVMNEYYATHNTEWTWPYADATTYAGPSNATSIFIGARPGTDPQRVQYTLRSGLRLTQSDQCPTRSDRQTIRFSMAKGGNVKTLINGSNTADVRLSTAICLCGESGNNGHCLDYRDLPGD